MQIKTGVSLKPYNTFGVEVEAKKFAEVESKDDILEVLKLEEPILVLGKGANVLFTRDIDGIVVINKLLGRKIISENKNDVIIEVGAGEDWPSLVEWTASNNWSGMENMALIPGTVGAAAVGNIGAYGQSVGEIILSVKFIDIQTYEEKEYSNSECLFYYRDSIFKNKLKDKIIITSVQFKLSKTAHFDTHYYSRYESLGAELSLIANEPYKPNDVVKAVSNLRRKKLPDWTKIGTAGSFFKNPVVTQEKYEQLKSQIAELQIYPAETADMVKIPAGRLLDELGWRGKRIGNVGTFDKHALVIVNYGEATGEEILNFANLMKDDVKNNFGVELEPEVRIISSSQ